MGIAPAALESKLASWIDHLVGIDGEQRWPGWGCGRSSGTIIPAKRVAQAVLFCRTKTF